MSLRLIKPGLTAAGLIDPRTGVPIVPIGYRRDGRPIWPIMGGASDDPDDPDFTGSDDSGNDDNDDSSSSDDDDDDAKAKKQAKHRKDDDDEDEDDDDKPRYSQAEYDRLKRRMQKADQRSSKLEERLRALENKDKPEDEVKSSELADAKAQADKLAARVREMTIHNAFLRSNDVEWEDPEDALALAERLGLFDDVIEDDGTVDQRALRRSLRDLAKKKPHLVKKTRKASGSDDDDEDAEDQGSVRPMNGKRKGSKPTSDRDELKRRFPALNRLG